MLNELADFHCLKLILLSFFLPFHWSEKETTLHTSQCTCVQTWDLCVQRWRMVTLCRCKSNTHIDGHIDNKSPFVMVIITFQWTHIQRINKILLMKITQQKMDKNSTNYLSKKSMKMPIWQTLLMIFWFLLFLIFHYTSTEHLELAHDQFFLHFSLFCAIALNGQGGMGVLNS